MMFKKEEGFTLVELMVVVLIIGILVAVAIPVFNAAQDSARRRACSANLRTLDGAAQQWVAADEDNDITTLQPDAADATVQAELSPYVKDWANSTNCPSPNGAQPYTVVDGDFTCGLTEGGGDHDYE